MPSWKKVIVSGSDAALNSLNVTTSLTASGIIYPTTDGTSGQVVITDGAGNLSFSNVENTTIIIKNVSGTTIAKGTPCYITGSGTAGNIAGVWPADASNPLRMPAGVIAGETLISEAEGIGLINGFISGVNTSAFNPGDTIYVAAGGGYTKIRPTGSAILIQKLGNVEKSSVSNGSGVINGPNYYNEVPNIQQGFTWVGNSNGVAIPVSTSSLLVTSASFAINASSSLFAVSSSRAVSSSFSTLAATATSASYTTIASSSLFATNASSSLRAISSSFATVAQSVLGTITNANTASNITPAITNAANDRILTANGGGTINGESNLIFDGTTLIVKGKLENGDSGCVATGTESHAEGRGTISSGQWSHSEGYETLAVADHSHAEGWQTHTVGGASHAEGRFTSASGPSSHAEGSSSLASGPASHAEGYLTTASAAYSHAEGYQTSASGDYSHAEGETTRAEGIGSHTEGVLTRASGQSSHAEGFRTIASGDYSHAEGYNTIAIGNSSHAAGNYTSASGNYQSVVGTYNKTSTSPSAFIIGNGTSEGSRSNLLFASGSQVQITGSLVVTGGITGSISGTTTSASFAISASHADVLDGLTAAAFVLNSQTSSMTVLSSSFAANASSSLRAISSSFATLAATATNATTATTANSTVAAATFNNAGSGDASGTTFNGGTARTISYNTVGAPSTSGTNATGTWGISITGNALTATSASFATNASSSLFAVSSSRAVSSSFATVAQSVLGTITNANTASNITPAITNAANNRVLTANGGGTINGEANLTFDGTTLIVVGKLENGNVSCVATGLDSHAEGSDSKAIGDYSHAEGINTITTGGGSHAEGYFTSASGLYSHAEGNLTISVGDWSHAEGNVTISVGDWSHAEGLQTSASGECSHAEGAGTNAIGDYSHAEGDSAYAIGLVSHAEGIATNAVGDGAHAEGESTYAGGYASHAAGVYTSASGDYQSVIGSWNMPSTNPSAFIIGNGTSFTNSNLLYASGSNVQITGSLYVSRSDNDQLSAIFATRGSKTNPAYTFIGDEDTGMYRDSANTLGLTAGSQIRLIASDTQLYLNPGTTTFQSNILTISDDPIPLVSKTPRGDVGVGSATNADNIAVTNTTTGTGPYYLMFADGTTGYRATRVDSSTLTFNATTNTLTVANLTGTSSFATLAASATTATNANNIAVTDTTTTNATHYVTFTTGTSGNQTLRTDSSTLTFNPSTNIFTVPTVNSTTAVQGANGSAATPAFSFSGDTNTGMYNAGADSLGFSTAGTARMTINSSGDVGIGITNPAAKLDVSSSGTVQTSILGRGLDGNFRLITRQDVSTNTNESVIGELGIDYTTTRNSAIRFHRGTGTTGGFISFTTDAGNERVRINSTGNVGIGTFFPVDKLDVTGAIRFRVNTPSFTAAPDNGVLDFVPTSIFPTDPQIRLTAVGTSTVGASIAFQTGLNSGSIAEAMRITSGGFVGVGMTNPTYKLQVNDSIASVTAFGNFTALQSIGGTGYRWTLANDSTFRLQYTTNGFSSVTTPLFVTSNGALGLNVTPTNTAGRFEASNDIVAFSTSDKRWKNNIVKIDSPLEKISQISGVEFDWIEDEPLHGNKGHDVGVIAQEIELVIPEAVQTRESGMKAVQYDKIIPLLIESIKEQQKQIDELKELVNKLTK
jgi:hypothetical protein